MVADRLRTRAAAGPAAATTGGPTVADDVPRAGPAGEVDRIRTHALAADDPESATGEPLLGRSDAGERAEG